MASDWNNMPRRHARPSSAWPVLIAALCGLVVAAGVEPAARAEDQRCKGTKQFYGGKCRYPDEIARMRAEERRRREAVEEARQRAEQERLEKEQAAAEEQACAQAQSVDTKEGWQQVLDTHSDGSCAERARARIAEIEQAEKPATPPPSAPAEPLPANDPPAGSAWEPTTLLWVGAAVTAAGAITWGVAGGLLVGKSGDLAEQCPDNRCPADQQSALDSAEMTAHVTTVGAVVTGVGAALAVAGALWPLFNEEEPEADASQDEAPLARIHVRIGGPFVGLHADF